MDLEQRFKKETGLDAYILNDLRGHIAIDTYVEWLEEQLTIAGVVGSKPTAFEKNNLPLEVRYAFCEAIEMYHNIQAYEMGLIDKTDFINHTIAIKDKYK